MLHRQGGTSVTYVTEGVGRAIELARSAAGDKDVAIAGGGSLLGQVLAAGLLDELDLHIVPVILGDGMRLFDPARLALPDFVGIELTPTRIVDTPGVTHVRYAVDGRASLAANAAA